MLVHVSDMVAVLRSLRVIHNMHVQLAVYVSSHMAAITGSSSLDRCSC